jgi:microcystin-dependent protein
MSAAALLDTNGIIQNQYLPSYVSSDVRNPMVANLDGGGFNITNVGAATVGTLNYTTLNPPILGLVPTGSVHQFAGATAPAGYLLCDGSSYAQSAYAALFAVIGTTYGGTAPNFLVPDFRGKMALGVSGSYARGSSGGNASITLTTNELPAHSHGITDPGHSHTYDTKAVTSSYTIAGSTYWKDDASATTSTATTGITINSAGSGNAFNSLNPYVAVNYIIKT